MIKTAINTRTIKYTSRCIAMKSHDPRRTVMAAFTCRCTVCDMPFPLHSTQSIIQYIGERKKTMNTEFLSKIINTRVIYLDENS